MRKKNQISLSFVSDLKYTEFCVLVFSFVKNVISMTDDIYFKTEISLREVINNAIIHGNKRDMQKRVHVTFRWTKSRLYMTVKDENPETVDFKEINKRLESNDLLAFNGRGIMIMKNYMDKVKFVSTGTGTEILLEKHL